MRGLRTVLTLCTGAMMTSTAAHACSQDTPCELGDRAYYIALPDAQDDTQASTSHAGTLDAGQPAVVYVHGFGGSGAGALRNSEMVDGFLDRGFAVIAAQGLPRIGSDGQPRGGNSWGFHPQSGRQEDEIAFLQSVRDDAVQKFGLDADNIILAGFSIGGSMTAYTACLAPDSFAAYAPLGGNFWRPHPTDCEAPVRMLHTHGWTDGTVPLEGRVLNRVPITDPSARAQGDIFHAMQIWRDTNECYHLKADRFVTSGDFLRRAWDRCAEGSALELAIFPRGHIVPEGWSDLVVDWYEGLD